MWSARNKLDSLLWEAAVDDLGIYCKSVFHGDVETPRTEWQDGWNAAVMKITEKHGKFSAWAESLTEEQQQQLHKMLDGDGEPISVHIHDDGVVLWIGCGDTFAYACSDVEAFALSSLPEICRLYDAHGYYGLVAWIAQQRKHEPVKEYRYNANYLAAKADLSALESTTEAVAVDPAAGIVTG